MPSLVAERSIFPDDLLDLPCDVGGERQWRVARTKARHEKALARDLQAIEIPFYLPLVRQYTHVRGRKACAFVPMFSGYLFLHADESERVRTLTTNRVAQVLSVPNQDSLRRDLRQLRGLIASRVPLTIEQMLSPGQRVRIKTGLLKGLEGTLLSRRGETRVLVAVNFVQQGASVQLEDFQLEPIY